MANLTSKTMQERDFQKITSAQKVLKILGTIATYAFLIIVAFVVLLPFYWMILSSVKTMNEYMKDPPSFLVTFWQTEGHELSSGLIYYKDLVFQNYSHVFTKINLGQLFANTIFVGVVSTILSLIITILSAFAFARLQFKGRDALFAALLATMMIPGELFTITNYITVAKLNWIDTYTVLIVPFLVSVFYIYLLRQNFLQIPNELYLAAKVDGTSDLKYLWKVMIPLALPSIISITILKMMGSWNTYMWPNLVINSEEKMLITQGIRNDSLFKWQHIVDEFGNVEFLYGGDMINVPLQMAAVAMVSLPLFIVFICFRKYIMKGVSRSGIKG